MATQYINRLIMMGVCCLLFFCKSSLADNTQVTGAIGPSSFANITSSVPVDQEGVALKYTIAGEFEFLHQENAFNASWGLIAQTFSATQTGVVYVTGQINVKLVNSAGTVIFADSCTIPAAVYTTAAQYNAAKSCSNPTNAYMGINGNIGFIRTAFLSNFGLSAGNYTFTITIDSGYLYIVHPANVTYPMTISTLEVGTTTNDTVRSRKGYLVTWNSNQSIDAADVTCTISNLPPNTDFGSVTPGVTNLTIRSTNVIRSSLNVNCSAASGTLPSSGTVDINYYSPNLQSASQYFPATQDTNWVVTGMRKQVGDPLPTVTVGQACPNSTVTPNITIFSDEPHAIYTVTSSTWTPTTDIVDWYLCYDGQDQLAQTGPITLPVMVDVSYNSAG